MAKIAGLLSKEGEKRDREEKAGAEKQYTLLPFTL